MKSGVARRVRSRLRAGIPLALFLAASPAAGETSRPKELSKQEKDAVLKLILASKNEKKWENRDRAQTRLTKAGKRIIPYLCELLESAPEDFPRSEVLAVLGEIGDRRALRGVARFTAPETPLDLRRLAVHVLSRIGGKGVAKYLVRLLGDKEFFISHAAYQGLSNLIHARRSDEAARREIGDLLLDELVRAEGRARMWVVVLLGLTRDKKAVRPLLRMVRSGPAELKRPALKALVRIGDSKAAPGLLDIVRGEKLDEKLRKEVISAVGSLGKEDLVPDMISLMEEKPEIARALADALAKITGQRIGPNAHAWSMWWTKKFEGEEAVLEMIGITRRPPTSADAGGLAATPGAEEERPVVAAPAAEPEKRRSHARMIVWAAMGAVLVIMVCVQLVHSRLQKAKVAKRRRKKTR